MSRFNNLAKARPRAQSPVAPVIPVAPPASRVLIDSARPTQALGSTRERPNMLATAGFIIYCLYIASGYLNDWALRFLGGKAYLSVATLLLLPVIWIICGNAFHGLKHPIGLWWA